MHNVASETTYIFNSMSKAFGIKHLIDVGADLFEMCPACNSKNIGCQDLCNVCMTCGQRSLRGRESLVLL